MGVSKRALTPAMFFLLLRKKIFPRRSPLSLIGQNWVTCPHPEQSPVKKTEIIWTGWNHSPLRMGWCLPWACCHPPAAYKVQLAKDRGMAEGNASVRELFQERHLQSGEGSAQQMSNICGLLSGDTLSKSLRLRSFWSTPWEVLAQDTDGRKKKKKRRQLAERERVKQRNRKLRNENE